MTATVHHLASTTRNRAMSTPSGAASGADVATSVRDASALVATEPRSTQSTRSFDSAVQVMAGHGRLNAAAEAKGDADRERALLVGQGEVLMAAGMLLIEEGRG